MSAAVWGLMPSQCRWIEKLRHCGKTLLRRQRRILRKIKKAYLNSWRTKDQLNMLVGGKIGGATPLVIACRNGHYDVAEYLIERCKADIEQAGSVTFDGETIEGAPPLWCAAATGHLPLVKLLVKAGANVNSTTRTHSTPLRAACFDGHYEIVKFLVDNGADIEIANRHGHTCLMIACYKGHIRIAKYLLSLNAQVNRKSVKGNTALHDCAESGSLHILKMLLGHGATMDVDSFGMTPLLAASVTGHTHIVEHLINSDYGLVSRQQRIDALELLGATYVDKWRDMVGALAKWKRAMEERFPADDRDPIPKSKDMPRIEAYDYAVEPSNFEELEELLADPDAMRMQALVIRERILGPAHPDTSYYVRYRGAVYADAGRYSRCHHLWHHALDMQRAVLPPLSPLTQSSLYSFAELFCYMLGERARPPLRGRIVPPIKFEDIEPVFTKALAELERGQEFVDSKHMDKIDNQNALQRILVISLHLAALMARLLEEPDCDEETNRAIHKAVYALVKLDIRVQHGRSALHVACSEDGGRARSPWGGASGNAPCCHRLVALMLKLGAQPYKLDTKGNTPLHLACMINPCPPNVVKELLKHGAHIDSVNYKGETPEHILKATQQSLNTIVNPLKYTTLKCLAARVVKNYRIPHRTIPTCLFETIATH